MARAMRLEDVLRLLPERELSSLIERTRVRVDSTKRIDVPSQVARALLMLPEVRDPTQLPSAARELLYRLAESQGTLYTNEVLPGLDLLVARGIAFVRKHEQGRLELILPIAFMVQMRHWQGEDPRGARALISQLSAEVAQSVATHYLGRAATPPLALALEAAWEVLNNDLLLESQIEQLAPLERRLLRSIEEVGGEVDTEELLELEREPLRLRGATGATPSRRGVGFALERRGLLIPVHPNRHVVPTEVARVVGAERKAEREAQRLAIRASVLSDDHAPRRAKFADNPVPLCLALALAARDPAIEVRDGIGTPRSLVTRLAARFGADANAVSLLVTLSRAIGLWDGSATGVETPPGGYAVHELSLALFRAWRRGGAWDEARSEPEVLRSALDAREPSPVGVLREMVLEALAELGDGRWAPWNSVLGYLRTDARRPGVARLLERWSGRTGFEVLEIEELARRIALDSLHALGVVDLGEGEELGESGAADTLLRITPRGRAFLRNDKPSVQPEGSRFVDGSTLRIGPMARVGQVLALAPLIEVGSVAGYLDVVVTPQTVLNALSAGIEPESIRQILEETAAIPDPIVRVLAQASTVVARADYVETGGFLWVEDQEIRELLRSRRQTADLFVDPSPPAGLLVAPGVDMDKLARRCRSLGIEILVQGQPHRTRSVVPPARAGSGPHRLESSSCLPQVRGDSRPPARRRSSPPLSAVKRPSR